MKNFKRKYHKKHFFGGNGEHLGYVIKTSPRNKYILAFWGWFGIILLYYLISARTFIPDSQNRWVNNMSPYPFFITLTK